jgi:hypothetical protein
MYPSDFYNNNKFWTGNHISPHFNKKKKTVFTYNNKQS